VIVSSGTNEATAPAGRVDALRVTGLENGPFNGETFRAKLAVWPATTLEVRPDAVIEYPATVTPRAGAVPPPGGGLVTTIFSVPLCARSPGTSVACNSAGFK